MNGVNSRSSWGAWIASALAMMVACAGTEDEMAFGPGPATVGNASSTPAGDDGDTEDGEDAESDDGDDDAADGPAPGDTGGADDGVPPPTDDGAPPPSDDGNPPPPPPDDDGGPPPPGDTTPNCQAYCDTLDMCGWVTAKGEMIEDCYFGCAEPLDMGPCDAAWDVLAGCFANLDCATLDEIFNTGMGAACQAEMQAELDACGGA